MDQPKSEGRSRASSLLEGKEPEAVDPEVAAVKHLLRLLDKTSKSYRTYGPTNPVARKFFDQLYRDIESHLATHQLLGFVIQRSELYFKDQSVYQPEAEGTSENFAFKLYADGIRELVITAGISREDLEFFLGALWGGTGQEGDEDDDDIVTRLWAKNLATITIVTAEEIAKVAGTLDILSPQVAGSMSAPPGRLREIIDQETSRLSKSQTGAGGTGASQRARFQSGLVGFENTEAEMVALQAEILAETRRDSVAYLVEVLSAIFVSEQSERVLSRCLDVFGSVMASLLEQGNWTVVTRVLGFLHESKGVRPDLTDAQQQRIAQILSDLGSPDQLKKIETCLNRSADVNTVDFPSVLLQMPPAAAPGLCGLLSNLQFPGHQAVVVDALVTLARETPEPVLRGLTDRRPGYVRHLLSILHRWNNPRHAEHVEKIVRYPDPHIRKEVIRLLGHLRPNGSGIRFVGSVGDPDETVRMAALKLLNDGPYTVPFSTWSPILSAEQFADRSQAEKRAIYQAVRQTSGDEAVPYWRELLTEWSWTNRKKKEDLALLAAEALGKLATPAAMQALELGQAKGGGSVRQACSNALVLAAKQQKSKSSAA
ncbi:MAG: HEAT repeat domain-containing protein [Nitrospiraceae bacterium]